MLLEILQVLSKHPCSAQDICEELGADITFVKAGISNLEKLGLIKKDKDSGLWNLVQKQDKEIIK